MDHSTCISDIIPGSLVRMTGDSKLIYPNDPVEGCNNPTRVGSGDLYLVIQINKNIDPPYISLLLICPDRKLAYMIMYDMERVA